MKIEKIIEELQWKLEEAEEELREKQAMCNDLEDEIQRIYKNMDRIEIAIDKLESLTCD